MPALSTYLNRINYAGPIEPRLDVLRAVHRAHLLNITYESLDIHLGRQLSLDLNTIFDKIVNRRRGGWCYEMNGLLAWALREIGFDVTLLAGTVGRDRLGAFAEGNHLVLLVKLDRPYLADAGFGNAILEPLPLIAGEFAQEGFVFRLERNKLPSLPERVGVGGGVRWIFHNHQHGGVGFDFTLRPHAMSDFAERCRWLQTSPESGFVRVTVCHRWREDGIYSLRGAMLQEITSDGVAERVIETKEEYHRALQGIFDLDLGSELDVLWSKVWQSHLAWVAAQTQSPL